MHGRVHVHVHVPSKFSIVFYTRETQVVQIIRVLEDYFIACFEKNEMELDNSKRHTSETDPRLVYATWLQRQYDTCCKVLLKLLSSAPSAATQTHSLLSLMQFVRERRYGDFDNILFAKIVTCMVSSSDTTAETLSGFIRKYMGHVDVLYHSLRTITKLCGEQTQRELTVESRTVDVPNGGDENLVSTVYDILSNVPLELLNNNEGKITSWCGALEDGVIATHSSGGGGGTSGGAKGAKWASAKLRKRAFSEAWLAFFRLEMPEDIYHKALSSLPDSIIPNLPSPLLLSDFLTLSLDRGGFTGMLALHGIFLLVSQHGLEYPNFYKRLYGLITGETLISRHRVKFFQLADVFLASPMIPAYTAAAFIKKFARLSLHTSPPGALVCITFIHNLLRRHPSCMQLLHRRPISGLYSPILISETEEGNSDAKGPVWKGEDVFDEQEADPSKARALESSLWELTALRHHADPTISSYTAVLDRNLSDRKKTAELNLLDVIATSYSSMFEREVQRRLKQIPVAGYATLPRSLFDSKDAVDFPGWSF